MTVLSFQKRGGRFTHMTVDAYELLNLVSCWPRNTSRLPLGRRDGAAQHTPVFTVGDAYTLMRDDAICAAQMDRGKAYFEEWSSWFNSNDQWDLLTDRSSCAAIVLGMDENTRHLWAAGGWNVLNPVQQWILGEVSQ